MSLENEFNRISKGDRFHYKRDDNTLVVMYLKYDDVVLHNEKDKEDIYKIHLSEFNDTNYIEFIKPE